jgi:hypothetical protein
VVVLYVLAVCLMLCLMMLFRHCTMAAGANMRQCMHETAALPATAPQPRTLPRHCMGNPHLIESIPQAIAADSPAAVPCPVALQVACLLRLLVLYMQYALILASVTSVELPAPLAYPLQALAWAWSPAVPGTLSIECILPHGSSMPVGILRMMFYLVMPVVLLVLMVAVDCIAFACGSNS